MIDIIKEYFRNSISTGFWKYFSDCKLEMLLNSKTTITNDSNQLMMIYQQFTVSIDYLYQVYIYFERNLEFLYQHLPNASLEFRYYLEKLQNLLMNSITLRSSTDTMTFRKILYMFFEKDFKSFIKLKEQVYKGDQEDEEEDEEDDLELSIQDIDLKESLFITLCRKLHRLNIINLSEDIFTEILYKKIFQYIEEKCQGNYEERFLDDTLQFCNNVLFKWLSMIILSGGQPQESDQLFKQWKTRFEFSIYENFAQQRVLELFSMIMHYPSSRPALEDLGVCFQKIPIRQVLIQHLSSVIGQRLLQPGAQTTDIISQYISTIQSLRIIDPSGSLIQTVGRPIKQYLAQREDTIRCIVSIFTDDTNELHKEFMNFRDNDTAELQEEESTILEYDHYLDDLDDQGNFEKSLQWVPLNNDNFNTNKKSSDDMFDNLVQIYESLDLFVNEYRSMLSERLLSAENHFDNALVEKEITNLELLKLRFGENSLHQCEIMVKDMTDSKRLNNLIHKEMGSVNKGVYETLILSELFWPSSALKDTLEPFKYPKEIIAQMGLFSKEYERVKAPRKLINRYDFGRVELELVMENGNTKEFTVSPIQASIISLFSSEGGDSESQVKLTLDQMCSALECKNKEQVRKKLQFWIANQVVKEVNGVYQLNVKDSSDTVSMAEVVDGDYVHGDSDEDTDSEDDVIIVEEQEEEKSVSEKEKEEKMRVIENFIIGMLTNFKVLTLDRIHNMLTMFNSEQYSSTQQELKQFLLKLINEEKIELNNTEYKIKN
ncbi:anaphase promoting complex subunit 2 [Tieghemostelium lacteum]|uniref:Anaphase-promoting complex subunit 2 n=1 Tax=Tieghemostelium lacteum TaxID=361077 RepID=A0A151Z979_TIELA|nr:anaphase promoting complex subunit 2 [Tieghemostelium lacteum]|eukprot:KYQ90483.1 anaphase promoting complex subunit 2 [Tieghemostelium lacteum]